MSESTLPASDPGEDVRAGAPFNDNMTGTGRTGIGTGTSGQAASSTTDAGPTMDGSLNAGATAEGMQDSATTGPAHRRWGANRGSARDYSSFDAEFRDHFNLFSSAEDGRYEEHEPAYHYGYDLARMERYEGRYWSEIEPDAGREWERVYPERPWDRMKEVVRHAWERTAGTEGPDSGRHSGSAGFSAGRAAACPGDTRNA